jgi:enoyl-CoA hydratase/carnithine racemase
MTPASGDVYVTASVEGELATVTLDRPHRLNSQTPTLWHQLRAIGSGLPGTVRVVVVRGAGRSFSAGLDRALFAPDGVPGEVSLKDLATMSPEQCSDQISEYQAAFGWLSAPDLISVAAVQGHAIGAGAQLALACDLRVLAEDAQLSLAEVPLGLVPDLGGTRRLLELVGYSQALEIILSGRRVGAAEALALGLANRVVPGTDLNAAVAATAQSLLALPRNSVIEAKALLLQASLRTQAEQELAERTANHRLLRELAGLDETWAPPLPK